MLLFSHKTLYVRHPITFCVQICSNAREVEYCFTSHQLICGYIATDDDEIDRNPDHQGSVKMHNILYSIRNCIDKA